MLHIHFFKTKKLFPFLKLMILNYQRVFRYIFTCFCLKGYMWYILDNNGVGLTLSSILDILDKLYQSFNQRSDLLPGPQKVLYYLSMDFALFLGMFNIKSLMMSLT